MGKAEEFGVGCFATRRRLDNAVLGVDLGMGGHGHGGESEMERTCLSSVLIFASFAVNLHREVPFVVRQIERNSICFK